MTAANEDTYPLTPMQQGMLFHALSSPRSGVDIEQLVITLPEGVDAPRMRAAWERAVARHPVLRTSFRWDDAEPLQVVADEVEVSLECEDQPAPAEIERASRIAAFLREDRARGFAMDVAPLMRLKLFTPSSASLPSTLVWTFHHALLDGRSFPIVLDEVFSFYDDSAPGEPAQPRPFRDFVEWQRARDFAASAGFWREHLAGFTAPTSLIVDRLAPRSDDEDCRQADAETACSPALTADLREFAGSIGVTLNTLMQGAWAILLSRYSRDDDVCFGATRACRAATVGGAGKMVGIFINTVPVRVRAPGDAPLIRWLRELRQFWLEVRPHEHTPLARVQSWSPLPAGQPLFQTLVVFENNDLSTHFRTRGGPWANRTLRLHEQTNYPICLAAYAGESLRLVAEYDRGVFDSDTVSRMLGHVRTLLESMASRRDAVLGELPMLPGTERAGLLAWSNPTPGGAPPHDWHGRTLHAIFSAQAARTPEATALAQGDTRITYAQLDSRSDAIAAHLVAHGAGEAGIVGLCMERTPDLVAALIGILKAGAAYLPIDLAYPPERLAFMLEDARAPLLLTQRSLAGRIPQNTASIVFTDDIPPVRTLPSIPPAAADPLCYVLYTSGSTGKPKGCCITHQNIVRLFTATDPWFRFNERDVWTLFHSTAFDFSVWEIWGALLHGGTLVVVPFETSRSPGHFHDLLVRERVTVLNQTPSAFRQLAAAGSASPESDALALRTVIFGGEALEMRSLQPWFDRHGDERPQLVNMYGITETTVHVTYRPLRATDTARGSVIGIPIPDLRLHILDARGEPSPIGVPGELHVGGAGLARGYHERPELTAQRFISDPFLPGERLYKTGDLARRLPDGDIEYLGRIDQQVKIRGFRIELGEIESALMQHPGVRECAVLARDDDHGGKKLIAWYAAQPSGSSVESADLRAHLARTLPDYMLPSAFVRVEKMPLTPNGKLGCDTSLRAPPPSARSPMSGAGF
jgi:amino acid adenylation domain-containing protein